MLAGYAGDPHTVTGLSLIGRGEAQELFPDAGVKILPRTDGRSQVAWPSQTPVILMEPKNP